jgi:hypothetical protein
MSPFDFSAGQSSHLGFSPASAPGGVHWLRPGLPPHLPPPLPESSAEESSERTNALIVLVLTFACTALAIFDLFLLASGL